MKKIRHITEAAALWVLFTAFRLLPLDAASYIGGLMARCIGPFLRSHRVAQKNLYMALPEKTPEERKKILAGMWDNLGRIAAEFPHLPNDTLLSRVKPEGLEHIPAPGKAAIFFSAHLGNWELTYPVIHVRGVPMDLFYRQANNPYANKVINRLRASRSTQLFSKGKRGGAGMTKAIRDGESLALLLDQKMNEGIGVPFFGREAMTAPIAGVLALRYGIPVLPIRAIRTKGAHFVTTLYPPLKYEKTGDNKKDTLAITIQINQIIESWVREFPEQWFWVHQRWPKD